MTAADQDPDRFADFGYERVPWDEKKARVRSVFDSVASRYELMNDGFGLRNVTDQERALASLYGVLKPGGRLLVLEFSHAQLGPLAPLYELYSFQVLPRLGEWLDRQ